MWLIQCDLVAENCVFWGNSTVGNGRDANLLQCSAVSRNCCFSPGGLATPGTAHTAYGNISSDPKFVDPVLGDLRLLEESPSIDSGNNYVDYDPSEPGYQSLPDYDLDGNWRVTDGDGRGDAIVDMGAYEYQGY